MKNKKILLDKMMKVNKLEKKAFKNKKTKLILQMMYSI